MLFGDRLGDDRDLVAEFLRDRAETRFRKLYRRHTPRMLRLARRLSFDGIPNSEDVVQEAWVRAVRAMPGFEWRSSLAAWLGGIVVNIAREHRRAFARTLLGPAETAARLDLDPLVALRLRQAIDRLPPGFRAVLTLHDFAGFTHEEIGAILGIEAGTSKSQLARARSRVRDLLGEDFMGQG